MAKKKSLFDDKPKEIQDLTYLIKQDINNLQSDIARLQEVTYFLIIISFLKIFLININTKSL